MNKKWFKENVFEEAKKYKTISEFQRKCGGAYHNALKNGWLNEMTHFIKIAKPKNYWTKERVFEEARKYKTYIEFINGCRRAYNVAKKNGWLDEMTWLKSRYKPKGYWQNKENVFAEARNYNTITEFEKEYPAAVASARKNGWTKEMTWFVDGRVELFNGKKDSVYKYYWEETNTIYIGRTLMRRQKDRENEHTSEEDTVYKYSKENGLAIPPMEIIEEKITIKEGLEMEDYWVNYYKERGYNVLNKGKTGIGSGSTGAIDSGKWTRNKTAVFEKSKEYKTRSEFKKGCPGAYNVAYRNDWLKEMPWLKLQRKRNISVLQIDRYTNEIIAEFPSAAEAERQLGYSDAHISQCCNGKQKTSYGYIWKYKESVA